MDIFAIGAVIMVAMAATKVVDRLSGEGFRGKSRPGDDNLAVFVLISGVGGLKTRHFLNFYSGTVCFVNQVVNSSSERAVSQMKESKVFFFRSRHDFQAVQTQKAFGDDQGGTFVSVDKRMIPGEFEGVRSCKSG